MCLVWVWTCARDDAQLSLCVSTPPLSSSLTSDQGTDLMERLTQRLNLHVADLTQLSYVQTQTHTYVVANNDPPRSLQTIRRIKDNWRLLKRFVFVLLRVKVVQML